MWSTSAQDGWAADSWGPESWAAPQACKGGAGAGAWGVDGAGAEWSAIDSPAAAASSWGGGKAKGGAPKAASAWGGGGGAKGGAKGGAGVSWEEEWPQQGGDEDSWQGKAASWQEPNKGGGKGKPLATAAAARGMPGLAANGCKGAAGSKGVSTGKSAQASTLNVHTQLPNGKDDLVVRTLIGTYVEKGESHGKKYYQKQEKAADFEDLTVFLYFWDNRDGADFGGWWFGDQIGGTQVFARCNVSTPLPPVKGWKVPWDSEKPTPNALVVEPATGTAASPASVVSAAGGKATKAGKLSPQPPRMAPPVAATPVASEEWIARAKQAQDHADEVVAAAKEVIAGAKAPGADPEEMVAYLEAQQEPIKEAQAWITSETAAAKAEGPSASPVLSQLARASSTLRPIQASLGVELNKLKGPLLKKQAADKLKLEQEARRKDAQDKATQDVEKVVPAAMEAVSAAEDSVEAVALLAAPYQTEGAPMGDDIEKALGEVEKAAGHATTKVAAGGRACNLALQTVRKAGNNDGTKDTIAELEALKVRLDAAQKKLGPFRKFKAEMSGKVKSRKAAAELSEKLTAAEEETEKVAAALQAGATPEEQLATEGQIQKAQANVMLAQKLIEMKRRSPDGAALKDELAAMQVRAKDCAARLADLAAEASKSRDAAKAGQLVSQAKEKVEKAEEQVQKCEETEAPFHEGAPALSEEEAPKAVKAAEDAASRAEKAVGQARGFVKQKIMDAKRLPVAELAEAICKDLDALLERLQDAAKTLTNTTKGTFEKKYASVMPDVLSLLSAAEVKVEAVREVAEAMSAAAEEGLKELTEKAQAAEKEASRAVAEAKKAMDAKSKELRGKSPAAVSQVSSRLQLATQELSKHHKAVANGEKLAKAKALLAEEEQKLRSAEESVAKAGLLAAPEELGEEAALELETLMSEVSKVLKAAARGLDELLKGALSASKEEVDKFSQRNKASLAALDALRAKTKDKREAALCGAYVKEIEKKVQAAEAAVEAAGDAELPFLSGVEVLPAEEAAEACAACENVATEAQSAISKAKTFATAKTLEIKRFTTPGAKGAAAEIPKSQERLKTAADRLAKFKKDVVGHRRRVDLQDAERGMATAEEEVVALSEAAKACEADDVGDLSAEAATSTCEKISELSAAAQAKLDAVQAKLRARSADAEKEEGQAELLKTLRERHAKASADLTKASKMASDYEHKFVALTLLGEAKAKLKAKDEEVAQVTAECAPLLEKGGEEFLVATSVMHLVDGLRQHMAAESLTQEALFAKIGGAGADDPIKQNTFETFLEALPVTLAREDMAFSADRRAAMFGHIDATKTGVISKEAFMEAFRRQYKVVKPVSITDDFVIASGKTVKKLELGAILEAVGESKKDENGMVRMECRLVGKEDLSGWVTLHGNAGTAFVEAISAYTTFMRENDKRIDEAVTSAKEVMEWLRARCADLQSIGEGSQAFKEARAELAKLRPKAIESQTKLNKLKQQVMAAARDFAKKEAAERVAHLEIKEKRAADAILSPAKVKAAAAEAAVAKLEEEAKPLLSKKAADEVADPLALREVCTEIFNAARTAATEALAGLKEALATEEVVKAAKGPLLEAKKELTDLGKKVEAGAVRRENALKAITAACKAIAETALASIIKALREESQKESSSLEALFDKLAGGSDAISQEAISAHAASLEIADLKAEHAKLACRQISNGSISRRSFMELLEKYYIVVKEVAMSAAFDLGKEKPVRKTEVNEIFQMLEGPMVSEALQVTRIRGRSLKDNSEGWVTICGNKGTPFLKETGKPYYACSRDVPLESTVEGGGELLRQLRTEEIVELIEGPRVVQSEFSDVLRARVKASKDGAQGFLVTRDQMGTVFAELSDKYYQVTQPTGLTDSFEVSSCKLVRKLAINEVFVALGEVREDEEKGIKRVEAKALKDGLTGWVAITGAKAGTVYAKPSPKYYEVRRETALSKQATGLGVAVRNLEEGEIVEVLVGPKAEKAETPMRMKGRTITDGVVGWLPFTGARACRPYYKCKKATSMTESSATDAAVVRELDIHEILEPLAAPEVVGETMRFRGRAERDGATGWVTIKDKAVTFFAAA